MPGYRTGYRMGLWLSGLPLWLILTVAGALAGFLFSEFVL